MQDVQTFRRFGLPPTVARTRWILGSQRRLVFFFDQGTLWPKPGPFPQTSHTAATSVHFHSIAICCLPLGNREIVPERSDRWPIQQPEQLCWIGRMITAAITNQRTRVRLDRVASCGWR